MQTVETTVDVIGGDMKAIPDLIKAELRLVDSKFPCAMDEITDVRTSMNDRFDGMRSHVDDRFDAVLRAVSEIIA